MCSEREGNCADLLQRLDADGDPVARGRAGEVHVWLYLNGDVMKISQGLYDALCLPVAGEDTTLTMFQSAKRYGIPMLML